MVNVFMGKKLTSINQDDKKISIALMSANVILTIQYLILIYFNLLESSAGSSVQLLSKVLVGIAFIYALLAVLKRSKIKFIGVYFVAVFIFLLHFTIFPENRTYIIDLIFPFFFMCLPAFVYTLSLRDFSIFREVTKKASYIVFVVGLIVGILAFTGRSSVGTYSMSLSYYMLLPTLVFLDDLFEKFSISKFIFLILSMIVILSLGSRGPVLCIIVFLFFKLFSPHHKKTYKKAILMFGLFGIAIVGFIFFDNILEFLYTTLLDYGINSRTLRLFMGEGIHLSGRDRIYKNVLEAISRNPILGIGIAGDRRVADSSYVHNLFIEIIANFGVIIGLALSVGLVLLIIKSLLIKDKKKYDLIIMWLSLGFVPLMVSGSYLTDMKFWIFLGLLLKFNCSKILYTKIDKKVV